MKSRSLFSGKLRSKLEKLGKEVEFYKNMAENALNDLNKAHSVAKVGSWKWYVRENRVEWSDEMYKIFGVDRSNFDGDLTGVINSRIHPDDRNKVYASNASVTKDGKPIAVDYRIILPDGTVKTVWAEAGELIYDSEHQPGILTGIVKDITEYVKLQDDLIQARKIAGDSEGKYRMFVDQTSEGIYLFEINPPARIDMPIEELVDYMYEKTILTECNHSFLLMYGAKDKSELLGKKLLDFHGGKDNPVNREEARNFVRNGFRTANQRTAELDSEGKMHFFSNASVGIIQDGYILRVWGTQADVTSLFEKEAELIKAKEKAEESDRLKTAFLNNMSHEIRTPLNGIVGFSQLLANPMLAAAKKEEFAGLVSKCSDKLIDIISDVTEMSKIQANEILFEYSEFDINDCISEIISVNRDQAVRKNVSLRLSTEIPVHKRIIRSDLHKIKKIFSHLIINAVKFTREGSVEVSTAFENGDLIVKVKDTGIGIHSSIISYIFEPFRQYENEGGNGLGLAIVKAYVEALGGNIAVHSEPGTGTSFLTRLPLTVSESAGRSLLEIKKDQIEEEKQAGINRILIAEDENINFLYLKELLQSEKTEVIRASNGKEAVDICMQNDNIDLILMDFMMPVMDGRAAAVKIKDFRPGLPIILQTAYSIETVNKTDVMIFDDYIPKPIRSEMLKQKLIRFVSL